MKLLGHEDSSGVCSFVQSHPYFFTIVRAFSFQLKLAYFPWISRIFKNMLLGRDGFGKKHVCHVILQSWALLFCQSPFYVKIDSFWARDLISCVNGCFWPKWRWVNSFFDFCPFRHTFLTFFENPKKPKMSFFELETWFFGGREVFDQYEHGSTHFFISALLRSKMALYS